MPLDFVPFPKIPRLSRAVVVTEKIDGTNAQVYIRPVDDTAEDGVDREVDGWLVRAGSRNRWIAPGKTTDNMGFARWVWDNAPELVALGEGHHYGEWWGQGIQRGYGLDHKRFSLFNTGRWNEENPQPECCHVVPVLYHGLFGQDEWTVDGLMDRLGNFGSRAAPGFMKPEGIIVYHTGSGTMFKKTFEGDDTGKGVK